MLLWQYHTKPFWSLAYGHLVIKHYQWLTYALGEGIIREQNWLKSLHIF